MLPLIPLFPFAGFLINAALGRRLPKNVSGLVATGAMGLSFGVSVAAVWRLLQLEPVGGVRAFEDTVFTWISSGGLEVPLTFRLDPLAALMILIVTGIGALIHLYSTAYMHEESDSRIRTLLLVPESLRGVHARAGPWRELPGDVHRLGRGRASVPTC